MKFEGNGIESTSEIAFCFSLLDKVMSRNQCHIGVQERHLVFKGLVQLNYNVLVFTHIYAMSVCIMTCTYPLI